jgi:hypothetical protein
MMRWFWCGALAFGLAGCGKESASSFHYSGEAVFNNEPIAMGEVIFTPNISKGNTGPPGFAIIKDGKFDTKGLEGRPCMAGPTTVHVNAKPKPDGSITCEYEYETDLPAGGGTLRIEVPASAGSKTFKR